MRLFLQVFLALIAGLAVGLGTGWVAIGRATTPTPFALASGPPLAPAVAAQPVPVAPAAPVGASPAPAATAKPAIAAVDSAIAAPAAPVPAADMKAQPASDPIAASLVPRGPGQFALLDLQGAGLTQVLVRQGTLVRDGAASWSTFANRPRLAVLHGPRARVELLHLGFDAEARPVVAHVRTTGHAGGEIEGVVALKIAETTIAVLADDRPPPPPIAQQAIAPAQRPTPALAPEPAVEPASPLDLHPQDDR